MPRSSRGANERGTNIDDALVVADQQVAEDAGFVEVPQADHVLHPVDGGGVHGLDVGGVLGGYRVLLRERERSLDAFFFSIIK